MLQLLQSYTLRRNYKLLQCRLLPQEQPLHLQQPMGSLNDLVDNVSTESEIAGDSAAKFAKGTLKGADNEISVKPGTLVRYMIYAGFEETFLVFEQSELG